MSHRIRHVAGFVALLATIGAGTGCAADVEQPSDEPRHVLSEPWQPRPFAIDATVLADAERACRGFQPPPGVNLAVVDARGASMVYLVYEGPRDEVECLVTVNPNGVAQSMGGGSTSGGLMAGPGPGEVIVVSSGSYGGDLPQDRKSTVIGRAGAGVARVEVRLGNEEAIAASLGPTGWFAAWWPSGTGYLSIEGYDGLGTLTGTTR